MATETGLTAEHTFVPQDNSLTAVFGAASAAREAKPKLSEMGFNSDQVGLVIGVKNSEAAQESPGIAQETRSPEEALDEILHSVTESFSDDDKVYVTFDRVLAGGGALLNIAMTGHEDSRTELAKFLRDNGAAAVYYWGPLATERL